MCSHNCRWGLSSGIENVLIIKNNNSCDTVKIEAHKTKQPQHILIWTGASILWGVGHGLPIFWHVFLCSQGSQDGCPNPFTENHMRGKAEKKTKMFSLPCLLYSIVPTAEVFREAKNAPNSCSVGALPRAPLGELMTTFPQTPYSAGEEMPPPIPQLTRRLRRFVLGAYPECWRRIDAGEFGIKTYYRLCVIKCYQGPCMLTTCTHPSSNWHTSSEHDSSWSRGHRHIKLAVVCRVGLRCLVPPF